MDVSSTNLHVVARSVPAGGGYGMFALHDVPPATPLFTVPASALLNLNTLLPHYPKSQPKLSSVQIIALHLLLHRPSNGSSKDPLFGPYIAVLPPNFNDHPLTWYCKSGEGPPSPASLLQERLTPSAKLDLERVATTYRKDRDCIRSYLKRKPEVIQSATNPNARNLLSSSDTVEDDFLWAWLNVNTRCIYYRIKGAKSDPDNLTLCPILDFANHSTVLPSVTPRVTNADIWDMPLKRRGESFTLMSPAASATKAGNELYLRYGFHSNQLLFVEYGFTTSVSEQDVLAGEQQADIDITPIVEEWFTNRGKVGDWMKEQLMGENYWGEWTLHSSPAPAHPSFRLVTALRLYHAIPLSVTVLEDTEQVKDALRRWRSTTAGIQESMSEVNEMQWRETLGQICQRVVDSANEKTKSLESLGACKSFEGSNGFLLECICSLWREELYVASAVMRSLQGGRPL
ncbi:hypothetical protein NMY22_g18116 [Coprinellus aureogranulatus]|nr:hypothetical protein NMY22_g18116 [Coprinellus aureogranulatus]